VNQPPKYPRIPYLWRDDARVDNVVPPNEVDVWFRTPVLVEEKLDGANVSLRVDGGGVRVALRGGADTMDRLDRRTNQLLSLTPTRRACIRPVTAPTPVRARPTVGEDLTVALRPCGSRTCRVRPE
jgi:hypothetical protein